MSIKKPRNDLKLPDHTQIKIFGDKTRTMVYIPDFLNYVKENIYDEDAIKQLIVNEVTNIINDGSFTVDLDPDKQELTTSLTSSGDVKTVGGALVYLDNFLSKNNQDCSDLKEEVDQLKKSVFPISLVASVTESFSTPLNVGSFETKVITMKDVNIKQGDLAMVSCEAGYTENGNLQYSASVLKDGEVNVYILNQSNVNLTVDKDINVKVVRFVA